MNYKEIAEILIGNAYECYLVGGAIRDKLNGKVPKDFDLATNAHPNQIMELFKSQNAKDIGKSFPVIMVDGVEIATFRKENSTGIGNKKTTIEYSDNIWEDLARRDFTVNAMAINLDTNEFIDPHNGKQDLKNNVLRFVGVPKDRIKDDPDRILRACRFFSKLGGFIVKDTLLALKDNVEYITFIAPERRRIEVIKCMDNTYASLFFRLLHDIGGLKYLFPSLENCWDHEHGKHHFESIADHNLICGDSITTKYPLVKLAGYLHDVGKPSAFIINNGSTFGKHEVYSRNLVEGELKNLTFSNDEIEEISGLVRCHMYSLRNITSKATRRLLKKFNDKNVNIDSFMRLRIADRKASVIKSPHSIGYIRKGLKTLKNPENQKLPFSAHDLSLSGGDIRDIWMLEGEEIGNVQRYLLTKTISDGISNEKQKLIEIVDIAIQEGDL